MPDDAPGKNDAQDIREGWGRFACAEGLPGTRAGGGRQRGKSSNKKIWGPTRKKKIQCNAALSTRARTSWKKPSGENRGFKRKP